MTIREKLKALREERGISVIDIAKAVGVGKVTYYRWEDGTIRSMSVEHFVKICRYLEVDPGEVLKEDKTMKYDVWAVNGYDSTDKVRIGEHLEKEEVERMIHEAGSKIFDCMYLPHVYEENTMFDVSSDFIKMRRTRQ